MDIVKKLRILLDRKQKLTMAGLVFLMIIGAVLETFSIGFLIPVLSAILDPDALLEIGIVKKVYEMFHLENTSQFIVLLMGTLILLFVLKNVFLQFQYVMQYRFVHSNQYRMARKMLISYMKRPYEFYLSADTAVLQRNITSDIINMYSLILCLLQMMSEIFVAAFLAIATMLLQPVMTLVLVGVLLLTLLLVRKVLKPIMSKSGEEHQKNYSGLLKWIQEAVMGMKEIKIGNREEYFVDEYVACNGRYIRAMHRYNVYRNIPKLLIETVCVAGMLAYLMARILAGNDVQTMVPLLGAFAMAVIRLLPSTNRISYYLTDIAYYKPFLMGITDNLQEELQDSRIAMDTLEWVPGKLDVSDKVELKDITYAYPGTDVLIFDHADMMIPIGDAVGIVGTSGAGKSTVVDILLGLLRLQGGQVLADGKDVMCRENYRLWLHNIGYIPQQIFMLDDTIRRNVAFGIAEDKVDEKRIWEVLREAQLDEFVRGLPEGLETSIGERGIRLSGGQRQRIGIARALYDDPEILVLDEATSALDNDTEAAIMDSINRLHGKKTLVIIAHRLQTIENCEIVYRVENGKVTRER